MKAKKAGDQHCELVAYANGKPCAEYILETQSLVDEHFVECFIPVAEGDELTVKGTFSGTYHEGAADLVVDGSYLQSSRFSNGFSEGPRHQKRKILLDKVLHCPIPADWTSPETPKDVWEGSIHAQELSSLKIDDLTLYEVESEEAIRPGIGSLEVVVSVNQDPLERHQDQEWDIQAGGWKIRDVVQVRKSGIVPDYTMRFEYFDWSTKVNPKRSKSHRTHWCGVRFGERPWARFIFYYRSQASIDAAGCIPRPDEFQALENPESVVIADGDTEASSPYETNSNGANDGNEIDWPVDDLAPVDSSHEASFTFDDIPLAHDEDGLHKHTNSLTGLLDSEDEAVDKSLQFSGLTHANAVSNTHIPPTLPFPSQLTPNSPNTTMASSDSSEFDRIPTQEQIISMIPPEGLPLNTLKEILRKCNATSFKAKQEFVRRCDLVANKYPQNHPSHYELKPEFSVKAPIVKQEVKPVASSNESYNTKQVFKREPSKLEPSPTWPPGNVSDTISPPNSADQLRKRTVADSASPKPSPKKARLATDDGLTLDALRRQKEETRARIAALEEKKMAKARKLQRAEEKAKRRRKREAQELERGLAELRELKEKQERLEEEVGSGGESDDVSGDENESDSDSDSDGDGGGYGLSEGEGESQT
jgi:hypothetical protein